MNAMPCRLSFGVFQSNLAVKVGELGLKAQWVRLDRTQGIHGSRSKSDRSGYR
jgi:hypothetical protein